MAEDEDPEIAAVLAKLAGHDAAAADDAWAALEWIAGDQGRVLITQQRIQNFCWYDLPVKWFVDLVGLSCAGRAPGGATVADQRPLRGAGGD